MIGPEHTGTTGTIGTHSGIVTLLIFSANISYAFVASGEEDNGDQREDE